jgi:hypothetical protein
VKSFDVAYSVFVLCFMLFISAVFISLFTHAWTRGGYAGKNKILEPHEVTLFVAHIVSAIGVVTFVAMCFIEPLLIVYLNREYGWDSKGGALAIAIGSGAVAVFKKRIIKTYDKDEETETPKAS